MSTIQFEPGKNEGAGFVVVTDDVKPLAAEDKNTLLRLMFEMTYTDKGRTLLRTYRPGPDTTPAELAEFRAALANAFTNDYGLGNNKASLVEALINAHFAASYWVLAQNVGNEVEMEKQQAIYQQHMAMVTWTVWEDFNGPEFSMNW